MFGYIFLFFVINVKINDWPLNFKPPLTRRMTNMLSNSENASKYAEQRETVRDHNPNQTVDCQKSDYDVTAEGR